MISELFLMIAMTGQCSVVIHNPQPYVVFQSPRVHYVLPRTYITPEPVVEYLYGNWSCNSCFKAKVYYGKDLIEVPIVNGYAPTIHRIGNRIIYDYRSETLYVKCKRPNMPKVTPKPAPLLEPPEPQKRSLVTIDKKTREKPPEPQTNSDAPNIDFSPKKESSIDDGPKPAALPPVEPPKRNVSPFDSDLKRPNDVKDNAPRIITPNYEISD